MSSDSFKVNLKSSKSRSALPPLREANHELPGYDTVVIRDEVSAPQEVTPSEGLGVTGHAYAGATVGTGLGTSTRLNVAIPRAGLGSRLPVKLPTVDPKLVTAVISKVKGIGTRSVSVPKSVPATLVRNETESSRFCCCAACCVLSSAPRATSNTH